MILDSLDKYNDDQVFNTDECGFHNEKPFGRTLERQVYGVVQSKGATTHSYTITQVVSKAGKLMPKLLLILEEPKEVVQTSGEAHSTSQRNVINLIDKFRATECTERKKSVRWPTKGTEDVVEDARERMQRGPNKSVKKCRFDYLWDTFLVNFQEMVSHSEVPDENLLRELECQVCMEYMVPPITFCENGHNICNNCKPKLKRCPTCKRHFLPVRNLALESIAIRSMYPCTNRRSGCMELHPINLIHGHQQECIYGQYKCPFYRESCPWIGSMPDMKSHFKDSHNDRIYMQSSENEAFSLRLLNVQPTTKYNSIVCLSGEFFFRRHEVRDNCFYVVLQYIGPKKDACRYKYRFCISNSDDTKRIEVTHVVRSIFEDLDDIYGRRNCVIILFDVIRDFSTGYNLPTEVYISEI
ncbi:hypothetical protein ANN_03440 [Periplaneta americana]|uniref:E3 ubiquitin-protein ligase n=1 Tax=Periplaneta americana TaxID=6978 RepID=A0ABQ8U0S1_PERAM|nr:hypothetical protein ANN_03440 [Periplaneta americana]